MRILHLQEVLEKPARRSQVQRAIRAGKVFVYPTDTVYGIGCDATNSASVKKIRRIKAGKGPLSVIAPSKQWIEKNCEPTNHSLLRKLPGPYILILHLRNPRAVSREVSRDTLGVRIPDHPLTGVIQETGLPFVTTSANAAGETPAWSAHGIPDDLERMVDIAIHDDIRTGPSSSIYDLTGKRARRIR